MKDKYPNTPYDLSNPHGLKDALVHTISTWMDYFHYVMELDSLIEKYDETLEHSDFSAWLRLGSDPESVDDLTADATMSLRESCELFEQLVERAQRNLAFVLKHALAAPPDIQLIALGDTYSVAQDEVDALLESLFDLASEMDYQYNINDAYASFMEFFKQYISMDGDQ